MKINREILRLLAALMVMGMIVGNISGCGCGKKNEPVEAVIPEEVETEPLEEDFFDTAVAVEEMPEEPVGEPGMEGLYFNRGVYANYPADEEDPQTECFYVFYDGGAGRTEDGNNGIGVPFVCEQTEGTVDFYFGGAGDSDDLFSVESVENGTVIGCFADGVRQVFIPLTDADPDEFDALSYLGSGSEAD